MKRTMILVVVMSVLLFSQLAFAQTLKINPLQAYTTHTYDEVPYAWWQLNAIPSQEYYLRALFTATNSGTYYTRIKVTDVKTGYFIRFPKEGPFSTSTGFWMQTSTPISAEPLSGVDPRLPRRIKLTYEFKVVGTTTWQGVSTLLWYY
jgi:hypothetical protein